MGIKIATIEDFSVAYAMAIKFAKSTRGSRFVKEDTVKSIVESFIMAPNNQRVLFLHEDKGMFMAMIQPYMLGDALQATEIAWWVEPEARKTGIGKEMLNAFEVWAKLMGCSILAMASLDDSVGSYYEKNGYVLNERSYLKEI